MDASIQNNWKIEFGRSLRTADDLFRAGFISGPEVEDYQLLLHRFQFLLPLYYANLIDKNNPNCPIRLQAIPRLVELRKHSESKSDPLEDLDHKPASRITHRYPNRALLHVTPNCSMYCRYCFRKTLLNEKSEELFDGFLGEALVYLRKHTEIEEVILSGGDPLMVDDTLLRDLVQNLSEMPHLKRLRIHSRVPVTFPIRITTGLARTLNSTRLPVIVVTHFNHPREITSKSTQAIRELKEAGVTLLNQSVLLKNVNDNAEVLGELSKLLFEIGILPYYLHHPDRAEGTLHFDLSPEVGLQIYSKLRSQLPGYLVPKYVIDVVGEPYKMGMDEFILKQNHFLERETESYSISMI